MLTKEEYKRIEEIRVEWEANDKIDQLDYDWLFDEFMTLEKQVELWNKIQYNLGNFDEIFYKTSELKKEDYVNPKFAELDLLQELMYPYYRVKEDGEQDFYNEVNVSNWISDDLYDNKYDSLNCIFSTIKDMVRE